MEESALFLTLSEHLIHGLTFNNFYDIFILISYMFLIFVKLEMTVTLDI